MSDIATLKSYLVNLGFKVDQPSLSQFTNILSQTAGLTKSTVATIATDVIKWQASVVGMFTAVSGAVVTMMDKVAMADQNYRLFGERMFMDTAHAKSLKIALDALNEPIEAIAFDRELHGRFTQLQKDQRELIAGLGGDFEQGMRSLRDIRFEFTRFQVELEYFAQGMAMQIFKGLGLGSGNFLQTLRQINDYIIQHVPEWSAKFAKYVVPILKDTWRIVVDLAKLFAALANDFTNFIAVISGDNSLKSKTFDFDKFAGAVEKVADGLASVLDGFIKIQTWVASHPALLGALGGGLAGSMFGPEGTIIGAGIGGGVGAIAGIGQHTAGGGAANGSTADQARTLAQQLSPKLNIPSDILYAQFAHETGNFSNRGATQLNNLAGIRLNGQYLSFSSLDEFGQYYSKMIQRNFPAAMGASDVDSFAKALKFKGRIGAYYGDTLGNYENGMRHFMPQGNGGRSGSTDNSVNIGAIHIMQPGADQEQIAQAVVHRIRQERQVQVQRNLAQLTSVYG